MNKTKTSYDACICVVRGLFFTHTLARFYVIEFILRKARLPRRKKKRGHITTVNVPLSFKFRYRSPSRRSYSQSPTLFFECVCMLADPTAMVVLQIADSSSLAILKPLDIPYKTTLLRMVDIDLSIMSDTYNLCVFSNTC